jgi:hypothetical protein
MCVWFWQAWHKAQPQNMPKDSNEYKVRGANCIACMHAVCVPIDAAFCVPTDADA